MQRVYSTSFSLPLTVGSALAFNHLGLWKTLAELFDFGKKQFWSKSYQLGGIYVCVRV